MHLALKNTREYLLLQLRKLIRKASKQDIEISCIAEGFMEKRFHLSQAGVGPTTQHQWGHLHLYASKGDAWTFAKLSQLNLDEDLPVEDLIEHLFINLKPSPMPLGEEVHPKVQFAHQNTTIFDEKLLNVDAQDTADFFRSRFLNDAPRKMLYEGFSSVGFRYVAYMDEHIPLLFQANTTFKVQALLRTQNTWLNISEEGTTLRQMRLAKIRPRMAAYWKADTVDIRDLPLPTSVILSHQCLCSLMEKLLQAQNHGDQSVWSWLKEGHREIQTHISLLPEVQDSQHPLYQLLYKILRIHEHPKGDIEGSLAELIEKPHLHAIVLQNAHVEVNHGRFQITSQGSGLIVNVGSEASIQFQHPITFNVSGEDIQAALSSQLSHLYLDGNQPPMQVPDFCILNDANPKILPGL